MKELFKDIPSQYAFDPKVENEVALSVAGGVVVGGMGGSHLSADFLLSLFPELPITVHHNYGLPPQAGVPKKLSDLYIAVSYSGDTEETLDFAKSALAQGGNVAVVTKGGALLQLAQEKQLPYIVLPHSDLPARMTLGFVAAALLKLMHRMEELSLMRAAVTFDFSEPEGVGKELAQFCMGGTPVIYASERNAAFANYLKVDLNETAKTPAFCAFFPELNHNEMSGSLSTHDGLRFVLLTDVADHPRVQKRMEVFQAIAAEHGAPVHAVALLGNDFMKMVRFSLLANWGAYYLAESRQVDPAANPLVEDFKKQIV